jgi:hypothetical protein
MFGCFCLEQLRQAASLYTSSVRHRRYPLAGAAAQPPQKQQQQRKQPQGLTAIAWATCRTWLGAAAAAVASWGRGVQPSSSAGEWELSCLLQLASHFHRWYYLKRSLAGTPCNHSGHVCKLCQAALCYHRWYINLLPVLQRSWCSSTQRSGSWQYSRRQSNAGRFPLRTTTSQPACMRNTTLLNRSIVQHLRFTARLLFGSFLAHPTY